MSLPGKREVIKDNIFWLKLKQTYHAVPAQHLFPVLPSGRLASWEAWKRKTPFTKMNFNTVFYKINKVNWVFARWNCSPGILQSGYRWQLCRDRRLECSPVPWPVSIPQCQCGGGVKILTEQKKDRYRSIRFKIPVGAKCETCSNFLLPAACFLPHRFLAIR